MIKIGSKVKSKRLLKHYNNDGSNLHGHVYAIVNPEEHTLPRTSWPDTYRGCKIAYVGFNEKVRPHVECDEHQMYYSLAFPVADLEEVE